MCRKLSFAAQRSNAAAGLLSPATAISLNGYRVWKGRIEITPIRGSCLCGAVKFEITGPLLRPLNCHCSQCGKQHGAAFRSHARVQATDLRWLRGEGLVKYYESSPDFHRGFCSNCGSPRPGPNSKNARINPSAISEFGVPLAILDGDLAVRPECHVFVASKAPWFAITDDLPQYADYPPPA